MKSICYLLLFIGILSFYQGYSLSQKLPEPVLMPNILSPQVADMMRYDVADVALSSGRVNLTIPLVDFQDPDFDFDISLQYSTDGFKPFTPDNFVGMHWFLSAGGIITREIKGIPDDSYQWRTKSDFIEGIDKRVSGFLNAPADMKLKEAMQNNSNLWDELEDVFFGQTGSVKCATAKGKNYEVSSDIYRFNFCGHEGLFMIDFDKTVKVVSYSGGRYKVDLSECNPRNGDNVNVSSVIKITTDDGYVYHFGGRYNVLEYTALQWSDFYEYRNTDKDSNWENFQYGQRNRHNEVAAYHLTKIVAPNGRTLRIDYLDQISDTYHAYPDRLMSSQATTLPEFKDYNLSYVVHPSLFPKDKLTPKDKDCFLNFTVSKTALISMISTDDKTVVFDYSAAGNPFFDYNRGKTEYYAFFAQCGAKLNSVKLQNNDYEVIESAVLTYENKSQCANRLLLQSVTNSKNGNYRFAYKKPSGFSNSITIDIDKWGFWSGLGANRHFKQEVYANPGETFSTDFMEYIRTPGDTNREPTGKEFDAFLLTSVTYPTGGKAEYTYEPHDYSPYVSQRSPNYQVQTTVSLAQKKIAGGARIKQIRFDDGFSVKPKIKYYKYSQGDDNIRSSGLLMQEGDDYLRGYYIVPTLSSLNNRRISLPNWNFHLMKPEFFSDYINYSEVAEYDLEDYTEIQDSAHTQVGGLDTREYVVEGPLKVTNFTQIPVGFTPRSYLSDKTMYAFSKGGEDWTDYERDAFNFHRYYFSVSKDLSPLGKKISKETYYTKDRKPIKTVIYKYETLDYGTCFYIHPFPAAQKSMVGCFSQVAEVPIFSNLLSEKITETYDEPGTVMTVVERYSRNQDGYLMQYDTYTSKGENLKKTYSYSFGNTEAPYSNMQVMNILSPIVKEQWAMDSRPTYSLNNHYALTTNNNNEQALPVIAAVAYSLDDTQPETRVRFLKYDTYGNPLHIIEDETRHKVYLWSYQGKYLIAMIENATYQEVESALENSSPKEISLMQEPEMAPINALRNKLPQALVHTYTQAPLVGMTSETAPNGVTTYYEYDASNRLSQIYIYNPRGEKSILKKYEYHLLNQ